MEAADAQSGSLRQDTSLTDSVTTSQAKPQAVHAMSSPSGKRSFSGKVEAKTPYYWCGKSGHAPEKCYHK